jgi:Uma2 family endonuclease
MSVTAETIGLTVADAAVLPVPVGRLSVEKYHALVAEVADFTLLSDRTFKKALYAQAGIATYWIVNLIDRRVEVYEEPTGATEQPSYAIRRDYGPDDEIPVAIDGREVGRISVADLLP